MSDSKKELDSKVDEWLSWDKNEKTRTEIKELASSGNYDRLSQLLLTRLQFGTAGLRGCMGAGYSQLNDLVIIQTTQGLNAYLQDVSKCVKEKGVAIGYDGRYNSKKFAELTAAIFLNSEIPVYLFSEVCPTPFVPFAVAHYKCAAGIMVTASHNPKEDNGYKLYWDNGAQIISPHDKNIQKYILDNLVPLDKSWETSVLQANPLLRDPLKDVMTYYYGALEKHIIYSNINADTRIKFTFSAMHGVGYPYMLEAFKVAQFKPFIVVEEQKDPDPEFPTVKFPNPEEGKGALALSFETANKNGSTVILANDPDADRLAVAEKSSAGNDWIVFTGNEIGALLGWWCLFCYQRQHPDQELKNVIMLSSTVSSKILKTMAQAEGFVFEETLTGFKWMGNRAFTLMAEGKDVLFAFEEAIGFMCGTAVLDKDGVSAGVRVAELVAYLQTQQLTLSDKLNQIYQKYGHHISENSYFICHDPRISKAIFEKLRNFKGEPNTYPDSIMNGKYKITDVRDLTSGYDSSQPDRKATLPVSKSSQMITFTFENGLVATLRTSGTEPKLKYYTELCASPKEQNVEVCRQILREMVDHIIEEFLKPEKNGLIARSS